MFDSLSDKLGSVFDKLRGKGSLSENDVMAVSREIRIALLEADVALPVVKDFIEQVKDKAIGQDLIKGVNPGQQFVKIVNDALVEMLGSDAQELAFATAPCAYLMVGLQGSGKTTSTAKISKWITEKHNKKVLMASLDVYRPAAQKQLEQLGEQTGVATLPIVDGQQPLDIAKRAMETARKEGYDLVMLDTAGRLSIDEEMMAEATAIQNYANPVETILVADAMTGQDAVQTAQAFDSQVGLTGIMLTRVDGDSRGGAALSMRAVTGKPIKLMGVGEKWDALEPFYPDRIAQRILGMGDIVSLVEKASETIDREDAQKMAEKFKKGQFDFNDLLSQMKQLGKMGGMGAMMKMMPGLGKMSKMMDEHGMDDSMIKKQEAIILSMTPAEREKPDLLNASRKKRIAAGSGTSVQELNQLIKQLKQMQTMMKRMKKMGMGGMMKQMQGLLGGKDMEALAQGMDPEMLAGDMAKADQGALGPNPFDTGAGALGANPFGGAPGGMPPDLAGMMGGIGGGAGRKATKSPKSKRKKGKKK